MCSYTFGYVVYVMVTLYNPPCTFIIEYLLIQNSKYLFFVFGIFFGSM